MEEPRAEALVLLPVEVVTAKPEIVTVSDAATSPDSALPDCSENEFCDCWARTDCRAVSIDCLCHCDYECPGEPPCDCDCGGGTYLGCAPATCTRFEFATTDNVAWDTDGCPFTQ